MSLLLFCVQVRYAESESEERKSAASLKARKKAAAVDRTDSQSKSFWIGLSSRLAHHCHRLAIELLQARRPNHARANHHVLPHKARRAPRADLDTPPARKAGRRRRAEAWPRRRGRLLLLRQPLPPKWRHNSRNDKHPKFRQIQEWKQRGRQQGVSVLHGRRSRSYHCHGRQSYRSG